MRTFVLVSLFVFSVYKVYAQTYFSKDYNFSLHQAVGGSVFCNINYYSSVSNIIDDVNIPGIKYKWKTVFSNITLNGDTLYTKIYNSKYSTYLFKTIKTYNDNYISVGAAVLDTVNYYEDSTQVALIMFDSSGDTIFFKNLLYAPNKKTYGYDIYQEADSGFVVCGITNKYSANMRAMLLRLDKDGNVLWEKTYPNAGDVYAYSLAKAADGGYLLGCTQWGGGTLGQNDMHIIKVDSMGNFMWSKLYGSTGNDAGAGISLTPDGGYILSGLGMYNSNQQWMDGAIRRIDATGNLIWEKLIGNINNNGFDWVYSLSDGNYVTLGSYRDTINPSAVNAWLVKFDIDGNIHWQRFYNKYGGNNHNYFRDLKETPDKGFVIIGELTNLSLWQQNMWLIKLDSLGCDVANCSVGVTEEMPNEFVFTLYPNPAQDVLHIETTYNKEQTVLYIYDITGKEILQTSIESNYQQLNISKLPAGMYLCRLIQGNYKIKTIKFIKE